MIGREQELAQGQQALTESRLVTLTAAGGIGKTRLAIEVGETELSRYRDGVWFVDLSALTSEDQVAPAVAQSLGLVLASEDARSRVVEYLSDIETLVILDNCEHLVDAVADLLEAFLAEPGRTGILATMREYFDIAGEHAIRLSPLAVTDQNSPAYELFVERAAAANLLIGDCRRPVLMSGSCPVSVSSTES